MDSLIESDEQWLTLLRIVAVQFLRADEAPDRVGAQAPLYKRQLDVALARIVAREHRAVANDKRTTTGVDDMFSTNLAPLTCKLLKECLDNKFWVNFVFFKKYLF